MYMQTEGYYLQWGNTHTLYSELCLCTHSGGWYLSRVFVCVPSQVRHGAGTGLREVLKCHSAGGGKLVGCTAEQVRQGNQDVVKNPVGGRGAGREAHRKQDVPFEQIVDLELDRSDSATPQVPSPWYWYSS